MISEETRRKMSESAKRTLNGFKKGHKVNVGNKHSEETLAKLREKALLDGRRPVQPVGFKHSEESKLKMSLSKKGKVGNWLGKKRENMKTPDHRKKVSEIMRIRVSEGKHNFWKGGLTLKNKLARTRLEYKLWREAVFKRDDYTCQECKERGGELNAHHLKPFSLFPELRYSIDNGITLCKQCHKNTDSYGRRAMCYNKGNN